MKAEFRQALVTGCECLTAWADLLDGINVFPIADGDTGRNLVISLSPLRRTGRNIADLKKDLLLSARGNSGNIAAAFFQSFIQGDSRETLPGAIRKGRDQAWQAVPDPRPGTMLTFFDTLADLFDDPINFQILPEYLHPLQDTVRDTINQQPRLQQAGVVDAGALGMYLFFEGFLSAYAGSSLIIQPIMETFGDLVRISSSYRNEPENGYCVDTILKTGADREQVEAMLASLGESVVIAREENCLKVHFHTDNREASRTCLSPFGEILGWAEDDLYRQTADFNRPRKRGSIHIMTDAAGSLTRDEARTLDITLLDSYITIGDQSLPETYVTPEALYGAMRSGIRVSTSQASVFERHQHFANVMGTYERVLYLCVGSAYTGNYQIAMDWKKDHDPDEHLAIIDTGAASGRLAVIVLAVAAFTEKSHGAEDVVAFARNVIHLAEEYIFLDRLAYLAAGGRLSKTGAFFGDMLGMKPVVTPMVDGARKAGLCRSGKDQKVFALKALSKSIDPGGKALIMLEYSDNPAWLESFADQVKKLYTQARILVHPLSLTSGAHMGPGTWAVAFLPDFPE